MSPLRAFLALILAAPAAFAVVGPDDVYQESNGILVMEAERTSSSLGTGTDRWETHTPGETNYVDGAANEAHIEFQGNGSNGGTPKTPLTYNFKINQGGFYYLHLRARARLDGAEPDKNNDCYVKVGGDSFGAGPNAGNTHMNDAPLSLLTNDTKMYGGSPTTWGWANLLDAGGTTNKRYPVYNFTSGGEYTLTISGRSIKFNIDRIVFRRSTVDEIAAKADTVAESATTPTSGATSANAGSDKSLILPTSSVVLNGSGSASTGSITSYAWSQVSGPSTAALSGAATVNLTASALVQGAYVFRLTVTTSEGQTATDDTIVNVAASGGSGQSVATLMLVNADTDNDIGPMTSGMTIDLAVTGANLNIRADTSPATVGSVRFSYDAVSNYMTQSGAPYTIGGDTLTDYWAWTPALGTHTLTATPYTLSAGGGTAGTPLTVVFTVINSQVTGNPVANAGTDQSITLPTSSVVLTGSGTDNGGSISSYAWSQVSGPSTATLSGAASANLTASALVQGSYIFRLTVTDNSGLTATDDTTVTVAAATSSNPVANAGNDKSITLPTSSVVLNGSGTDTGGSISSYAWSQVSGPSTATLSGAASANLTASALVQGAYIFRLTVTDNSGLTATDDAIVNVAASTGSGQAVATLMLVNADTDNDIGPMTSGMTIDLAVTGANLNIRADTSPVTVGSVRFSYDAVSNYMTQSGAPYTIGGDTLTDYWAWTPALGTHTLTATPYTLSAGGGTAGTPLTVVFTVINSQITGNPVANAGTDKSITLPTSSVVLNGSGTDTGGSISSYAWSQVSGPSTATLSGAASANLTASALVQGSYIFRLTVTDNSGLTATDDTTVTVAAAPSSNPIVSAGSDQTIIRPASTATLTGSASDPGGSISSHAWIQLTGPSTATLSGAATPVLGLSGLIQGTYTFRLTVTDNSGNIASDEAAVSVLPATSGPAIVSGELKKWHKVTLSFTGPATSESATPNPFTDYRLNVTFTHPATGKSYIIPGYYAADGNAANTSATSGNVWRVHFAPDETGAWTYLASFRSGTNIATDTAAGPSAGFFDASAGNFSIAATDKSGTDFRGKGRLDYVGKHHLRFAETGEYFMKAGVDAPENLLAYQDFDGDFKTDGQGDTYIKVWTAHVADWQTGDPVWQGTKGKGLIGAINYLASEGLNAFSFLTMNINGDDKNVFPYSSYGERVRLDVSKLDQWEMVFEHGTKKGMHLHFKTQEIENQNLLDGGDLGNQRKLYYRELMARFGHHPALNWNLGEECTATTTRKKSWAQYFHDNDPYKHPIVIHNTTSVLHKELLGSASKLTGFSLQLNASDFTDMFTMTKDYIDDSAATGRPWVVACDEPGDSQYSLRPDSDSGAATSHTNARKNAIWGNIMAGGAGCEYYFGYALAHSDLTCQDFRSRNAFWDYCRYALQFLDANDVPFQEMSNQNSLVSGNGNNANRCLAKTGQSYLVQLHSGGTHTLNLSGASGQFTVKWLNPRTGATVTRPNITGGGSVSLGSPPDTTTQDWIVFVQTSSASPTNTAPLVNAGPDKSAILSAASVQVALTGTVTDDGLPDALALSRNWSFVSGPAAVTFSPANTAATTASFTALGTYLLRLTSSDTQFTASDDVQVTISAPAVGGNAPPVFSGFSTSIAANQSVFISHTLILNGSSDPDGDPVSLVVGDGTSTGGGSVTMSDGLLVYTPVTGFNGADSFPLTVQDGRGGFSTAPLLIQVGPPVSDGITGNPPPVLEKLAGNQMRIRYTGNPGLSYAFQRSTNLVNWTTLQTLTSGANGTVEYTDPNPPAGNAFYRIATP